MIRVTCSKSSFRTSKSCWRCASWSSPHCPPCSTSKVSNWAISSSRRSTRTLWCSPCSTSTPSTQYSQKMFRLQWQKKIPWPRLAVKRRRPPGPHRTHRHQSCTVRIETPTLSTWTPRTHRWRAQFCLKSQHFRLRTNSAPKKTCWALRRSSKRTMCRSRPSNPTKIPSSTTTIKLEWPG